jgi:hypothetical protein
VKKVLVPVLPILFLALAIVSLAPAASAQTVKPNTAPAADDASEGGRASQTLGVPDPRINGKWHFVFDTAGGDREFNAEFHVDADGKVTGTWVDAPATGTYKDGHLQMAFDTYSAEVGATAQLTLDGKIDETGAISGTWTFSTYDGTFKATHPKP